MPPAQPFLFEEGSPFRALFDAMSARVFIVDRDYVVHDANLAAVRALGPGAEPALKRLCGDVLRCLNSGIDPQRGLAGPCGGTERCEDCVLRQSTGAAIEDGPTPRRPYAMRLLVGPEQREAHFVVNATPFEHQGRRYAMLVLEDVTELQELRRLVPQCAWCRRVYLAGGFHAGVERRLREAALIDLAHGICPDCVARHFPGVAGPGGEPPGSGC